MKGVQGVDLPKQPYEEKYCVAVTRVNIGPLLSAGCLYTPPPLTAGQGIRHPHMCPTLCKNVMAVCWCQSTEVKMAQHDWTEKDK